MGPPHVRVRRREESDGVGWLRGCFEDDFAYSVAVIEPSKRIIGRAECER